MVQAPQLVAALHDLQATVLPRALVHRHETRREVRIERAGVVPVPLCGRRRTVSVRRLMACVRAA